MAYTISCKDAGVNCSYSATSNSVTKLMREIVRHGKEEHGMTDEEFSDPQFRSKISSAIKEV